MSLRTMIASFMMIATLAGCGGGGGSTGGTTTASTSTSTTTSTAATPTPTSTPSPTPTATPTPTPSPAPSTAYWVPYFTIDASKGLQFTPDAGVRSTRGTAAPRILVLPDGRIRLFYPTQQGLSSSISSDGLTFTDENVPLHVTGDIAVIYMNDGRYRILYPQGPQGSQTLGSAISSDGLSFTVEAGTRYTPGPQDAGLVQVPSVVRLADGRWRLYYVGDWNGSGGSLHRNNTRTAISSDEGLTFTAERQSDVLPADTIDPDAVYLAGGGYRLYGKSFDSFFAVDSPDGVTFPTFDPAAKSVMNGNNRVDPCVVRLPNGTVRLFFGTTAGIESATAAP